MLSSRFCISVIAGEAMKASAVVIVSGMICFFGWAQGPAGPSAEELQQAVSAMRHIQPGQMSEEQRKSTSQELNKAWDVVSRTGQKGMEALQQELRTLQQSEEKDDCFKLGAAALLWDIGKLEKADDVAAIWSGNVDLSVH
jgi:hypothetical protein